MVTGIGIATWSGRDWKLSRKAFIVAQQFERLVDAVHMQVDRTALVVHAHRQAAAEALLTSLNFTSASAENRP